MPDRRLARLLLLICAVLLPAGLLASCGGDDERDSSPRGVLEGAFGEGTSLKSGRLGLALDLDLQGLQGLSGPIKLKLDGPFQSQGGGKLPDFDLDLDITAGGDTFTAGATSTGEKGYVTLQGQAFDLGDQLYRQFRDGYEQANKEADGGKGDSADGPTFESLGIKPLTWLRDPAGAGEQQIGGTATNHVRARVDVPKLLEDVSRLLDRAEGLELEGAGKVPGGLTAEQRRDIARSVKSAQVDVWAGKDDGALRRMAVDVDVAVPDDAREGVGGLQSGRIAFTFSVRDLNEEQTVRAPTGARPFSELQAALGGALGATGATGSSAGGGTTTAPGTGAGGGGAADAPKAYLDCLAKAGQDVEKIQGCGRFL
ncbi:hypothetical protein [Conexibacter sp. SYSU D00693]|uniref:hypothetical protein n=1 Tax=Conexibacter sp. SYSU D00693 TaxID=2812560 RepID=UPI00196A4B1B|nr:hypothetical protein [Conexibacter sp. SYSU D00693]